MSGIAGSATVNVTDDDDPDAALPEVSVAAGTGVTEGGDASFTVSASPVPSVPLSVSVSVVQTGDFGVSTGSRAVTVPTSGSVTVTVATSDDDIDEVDGSVGVTVNGGSTYTVSGIAGSATVNVADDDDPPPASDGCTVALAGSGTVQGRWDSSCGSVERTGRNARFFTFSLDASANVRIDLESSYDTYLFLRRGLDQRSGSYVARDDDGGNGYNSRIARTLSAGDYTIEATTFRGSRSGPFTLRVSGVPAQRLIQVKPQVSVTAGVGITEGANASFTVTASPAPSAPLSVSVGVAQSGDFGVTTGSRTVTVPTSGTATVTVSTSGDDTDEDDGSVTVTVASGSGYTVSGIAGSASVNVADDDDPPPVTPEVSVAAGAGVTEGANASFTVAASPAPSAPLSVSVTVAQTGDFGVSTGSRTVTVPTTGSVTVTVSTSDDDTDEVGGSVTVTINSGSAYTVSDNGGRATVNVADDDDPPVTSDGCTQALTGSGSVSHRWDSSCGSVERSNRYARFYTFSLNNSALVRIDLESSQDTYLYLRRGLDERSSRLVVRDDDSGVGLNSRIVRTLSAGDYTIEATTYSVRRSGAFTLRVSGVPAQNPNQVIPQLSVAAGVGITEGADATFTVSASPAPSAPLSVSVTVSQTGDFGATTGSRIVTIPTSGSVTVTVGTSNDSSDETDGSITVTVNGGSGYTVSGTAGTASVNVADDDDPPPTDLPVVSIADASVVEGELPGFSLLEFRLTLTRPADNNVTVSYLLYMGTTSPSDHHGGYGQARIWAGQTTGYVVILVLDDRLREADETLEIELTDADGATIDTENNTATGTIIDND